ncbi:hypothetical protein FLL45_01715 [Aliikangiella marina]|uniref:Scaffold protein FimL second domain-containing protein n=1 Tax=Aliikangiella marina TaxID=1712262 RepID=A0A545THJ3_9GAMM|nr:hypothetical protein [Aliikangiella marina]TQV76703.1 hypothetical protein FLL45_01715 [Aliikangiella marina]
MQYQSSLQSLDLILDDIEKETEQVINQLNLFLESNSKDDEAQSAIIQAESHLHRLKGVFILLELPGCLTLTNDLLAVVKKLPSVKPRNQSKLTEAIYTATVRIVKYVRHIKHKRHDLPELILPFINELRTTINAKQLPESFFFEATQKKKRKAFQSAVIITEQSASKSRYLRQMYQIGLIEVLRRTNVSGGLKMMQNALAKLDNECRPPLYPDIWWIASALVDSLASKNLKLTLKRLKLFSLIDRQIKFLEHNSQQNRQENKESISSLANELIYLISISNQKSELSCEVLSYFELNNQLEITDELIRKELVFLRGPGEDDFASLSEALLTEIKEISAELQLLNVGKVSQSDIAHFKQKLINLNSLLSVIQVEEHTLRMSVAIDLLDKIENQQQSLGHSDMNIIKRVLAAIESSISDQDTLSHVNDLFDCSLSLSDEKEAIRSNTHKTIKSLIINFSRFVDSGRRALLLKNIPELLKETKEGFLLLDLGETSRIFDDCVKYVTIHLMNAPTRTSQESMDLFADIVGSLDFYLETLKYTNAPSAKILKFAENSCFELRKLMKNPVNKRISNF